MKAEPSNESPHVESDDPISSNYPRLESPYDGQRVTPWRHIKISAYWFATNFLWGALLTIMLPEEARRLAPHYRVPAIGILSGISSIVALVVPLVAGALSDRCAHPLGRRRPFIIVGVGINLVGLFAMDVAFRGAQPITAGAGSDPSFWQAAGLLLSSPGFVFFLLAYMVVQFGNNVATAAYSGIIPDLIPQEQRGTASGYMGLMSQVGTLVGVVACGFMPGGETRKYLLLAVVLTVVAGLTILGVREKPLPQKPPPMQWRKYLRSLWIDPRIYPDFAWVWITRALVMMGFYAVLPFVNYYFTDVIGIENPDHDASFMIAAILIASSISGVIGGVISDRIGRKKVVYIANSFIAVTSLGLIACTTLPQVLTLGVIFGLGYGAYISVDWALGTDVLPSKVDAAKEMGVWHIAMTLPQTIASPVAGFLIAIPGMQAVAKGDETIYHYTHLGYGFVFVFAAVCFALGAYFLKFVKGVT